MAPHSLIVRLDVNNDFSPWGKKSFPQGLGVSSEMAFWAGKPTRDLVDRSFGLGEIHQSFQISEVATLSWLVQVDTNGGCFPWEKDFVSPGSGGQLRDGVCSSKWNQSPC